MSQLQSERAAWASYVREQNWMPTSRAAYEYQFGRLADWLEQNGLSLRDCSPADMADFLEEADWGNALRNKTSTLLRPFIQWLFGQSHPLANWVIRREKTPPQRFLTKEQLEILFASFQPGLTRGGGANNRYRTCDTRKPLGLRNLAIMRLLADSGLRASELCRVQIPRLDFDKGLITVRVKGGQQGFGFFTVKTGEVLRAWIHARQSLATEASQDFLFIGTSPSHKGQRLNNEGLRKMFRQMGEITGIGPFSPHDLRRTFAILTPELGHADDYEMMKAGNWKDAKTYHEYRRHKIDLAIRHKLIGNFV